MKVGMFSYCPFMEMVRSECFWHIKDERHVLVVQDLDTPAQGLVCPAPQSLLTKGPRYIVERLWERAGSETEELTHIVIHLGRYGIFPSMELMNACHLPPSSMTIVMCKCDTHLKRELIKEHKLTEARIVTSEECGCSKVMRDIFEHTLEEGNISPYSLPSQF